eukprot:1159535-Pelagomonas_calceolata.AAC.4
MICASFAWEQFLYLHVAQSKLGKTKLSPAVSSSLTEEDTIRQPRGNQRGKSPYPAGKSIMINQ